MLVLWVLHFCEPELGLGSLWDEWPSYSPKSFLPEVVFRGKAAVNLYNLSSAIRPCCWGVGLKATKKLGCDFYPGTVVEMMT